MIFISQCCVKSYTCNNNDDTKKNIGGAISDNDNYNNVERCIASSITEKAEKAEKADGSDISTNEELKWNGQSQSSLVLKLKAPYGTYIRILVNDTAVSMPGYCRGSHPKLYNQADALSLWSRSSSSIFLSRYCTGTERTCDINLCYHLLTLNSCHDLFLFSFDHPLYSLIISFFFL